MLPHPGATLPFTQSLDCQVGSCLGVTKTSNIFSDGYKEILEIETEDGFSLGVSPEHRLLTWENDLLIFRPAETLGPYTQVLMRCNWQSFSCDENPFNIPPELWFPALVYFYVTFPRRWPEIWQQRQARKRIAQPLWEFFKHTSWGTLPPELEWFLTSQEFGSHLLPQVLRQCSRDSARIIARAFWWANQHLKFTEEQAKEVQTWFLNLGLPLSRVGPTLMHRNVDLRRHFHAYLKGKEQESYYTEEQIIELASLVFLEISQSAFIAPIIKMRAHEMACKGFSNRPRQASRFVSEFLQHTKSIRRFSFLFRFPFFLQKIKDVKKRKCLTMDLTTIEGNYLANGIIGHNSTICGQYYSLWRALRNPNIRIGIISKSSIFASMTVSKIKHIMETNERIARTWPDLIVPKKAQKWNNSELTLIRKATLTDPTFSSLGVGTSLAGRHFDILIFDDIVDTDHQSSDILRKRVWDWFRFVAMQTLSVAEYTQAHIIGTLYHPSDLYHKVIEFEKDGKGDWASLIQPAINPDGTSFWEEMFPLSALQEIEATYGPDVFQLQYQNDPDYGGSGLTWEEFSGHFYKVEDLNVNELEVTMGVDLAAPGTEKRGQHSAFAIAVVGVDRSTQRMYVLDLLKRKNLKMSDQRAFIENYYTRYKHTSTIQVENYAVQAFFHEYLDESELILPYAKVQTGGTKESRFEHILKLVDLERLFFKEHEHNELIEEIINFPNTSADLIDAVYLAIKGFHREPKIRFLNF